MLAALLHFWKYTPGAGRPFLASIRSDNETLVIVPTPLQAEPLPIHFHQARSATGGHRLGPPLRNFGDLPMK